MTAPVGEKDLQRLKIEAKQANRQLLLNGSFVLDENTAAEMRAARVNLMEIFQDNIDSIWVQETRGQDGPLQMVLDAIARLYHPSSPWRQAGLAIYEHNVKKREQARTESKKRAQIAPEARTAPEAPSTSKSLGAPKALKRDVIDLTKIPAIPMAQQFATPSSGRTTFFNTGSGLNITVEVGDQPSNLGPGATLLAICQDEYQKSRFNKIWPWDKADVALYGRQAPRETRERAQEAEKRPKPAAQPTQPTQRLVHGNPWPAPQQMSASNWPLPSARLLPAPAAPQPQAKTMPRRRRR